MEIADIDRAILATALDAEGYIGVSVSWNKQRSATIIDTRIQIINTDLRLLESWSNRLRIGRIYSRSYNNAHRRYDWCINKQEEQLLFLKLVLPYLIGKREHAELMIEFLQSRLAVKKARTDSLPYTQHDVELFNQIRGLNRRRQWGNVAPAIKIGSHHAPYQTRVRGGE